MVWGGGWNDDEQTIFDRKLMSFVYDLLNEYQAIKANLSRRVDNDFIVYICLKEK